MIRDAEDEELGDTDAQDVACLVVELATAELGNPVIEQPAVTQDGGDDCLKKCAIGAAQAVSGGVTFDQRVHIRVSLRPCPEGGDGGAADVGCLGGHGGAKLDGVDAIRNTNFQNIQECLREG